MRKILLLVVLGILLSCRAIAQPNCLDSIGIALIPSPQKCHIYGSKWHKLRSITVDSLHLQTNGTDEYGISIHHGIAIIWGNLHWALSTLDQLKDNRDRVPDLVIHDWAAYPLRGFMHDVGRNFQPLDMLKETLDLMCRYKLNVFHWHLTDYPAWRIECRCHPELNNPQYQIPGRDEGLFYTYNQIRELITYANERGITVMPEIDMPGHSTYFNNAFDCSMDSDKGRKILQDCLEEFFGELPPSLCPFLHVGGDEIWIINPESFSFWVQNLVHNAGYRPMAWSPGLPAATYTIRQLWNEASTSNNPEGENRGKYVDSFVGYLNYYDPTLYTMRAFMHQACGQSSPDTSSALGGILCLWNDVRVTDKSRIALHNGMLQGIMAFAERFWQGGSPCNGEPCGEENLYPHPGTNAFQAYSVMEQRIKFHGSRYYGDKLRWRPNANIMWSIMLEDTIVDACGGYVDLDALCQYHGINPDNIDTVVAECILPESGIQNIWLGFDVPARSDRMATGIGGQGQWENNAHAYLITTNDTTEILPPSPWLEPSKYNYPYHTWHKAESEQPYTDEQFYWMRPSVRLFLPQEGCRLRVVQPHSFKGQRWGIAVIY